MGDDAAACKNGDR